MAYHKIWVIYFMPTHNSEGGSESEQMYLITIARAIEDGEPEPLPLTYLANKMSLQPVSINQMVRKLEGEGLVHYHPYKGVQLTTEGQEIASRTLRNRRLWEVFLVEQLHLSIKEADEVACNLEHVTPDNIALRLSRYLDEPVAGPDGHLIPRISGEMINTDWMTLEQLEVGMRAQVLKIEAQPAVVRFLSSEGLQPGAELTLEAIGSQGSRLLSVGQGFVEITVDLAESIQLRMIKTNFDTTQVSAN
jgi:DtxR family Mn-dependent transcriptional regulator